jgi:hypothetical protein
MTVSNIIFRLQITMLASLAMLGCAGVPNGLDRTPDEPQATSEPATKEPAPAKPRPVSPRKNDNLSARVLVAQARHFTLTPAQGKIAQFPKVPKPG